MNRFAYLVAGVILGAGLFQGARHVRRELIASQQPSQPGHAHSPGNDWTTASDSDLEIARVVLTARRAGVGAAMDTLSALVHRDSTMAKLGETTLHQVAHSIGRAAGARPEGINAFRDCRPGFLSGCPHGVMEGYFSNRPPADSASLRALCAKAALQSPPMWVRECAHGVGHGLFQTSGGDVNSSLKRCRALEGATMQRECTDGVFMSAVQRDLAGAHASSSEPRCSRYPDDLASCWSYEAAFLMSQNNNDPERAMRGCPSTPADVARECYAGFGRQIAGLKTTDYAAAARLCRAAGSHAGDCVEGAVIVYTDQSWTDDQARKFCGVLTGDLRSACDRAVGTEMRLKSGE